MRARNATLLLRVPYRSQLDGTPYARANCGPASIAMVLQAYGIDVVTNDLRLIVNTLQGSWGYDDGTSWQALETIAIDYGLTPLDVESQEYFRKWTLQEVRQHLTEGHPVIILVKYRMLPGNGNSRSDVDHYIVITGMDGDRFIYNDAAFWGDDGYALVADPGVILQAWGNAVLPMTAMAVGPGPEQPPLPKLLSRALRSGRGPGSDDMRIAASADNIEAGQQEEMANDDAVTKAVGSPFDDNQISEEDAKAIYSGITFSDELNPEEASIADSEPENENDDRTWKFPLAIGLALLGSQILPKRLSRYL